MNDIVNDKAQAITDTAAQPVITVSIIVHDDFSHIPRLLATVASHPGCRICVTLNTGMTPEAEMLKQQFPSVDYIVNTTPRGFAANHNAVIRTAQTPFVALLNDDIMLADDAIDDMVGYLQQNPHVGIATPRIVNADGSPHVTAFHDPGLLRMIFRISGLGRLTPHGGWIRRFVEKLGISDKIGAASASSHEDARQVPVVIGVAMFVRRAAYEQAGLMDEETRFYGEEFGWQLRMRRVGWQAAVVGSVVAAHFNPGQDLSGWKLAEHRKSILNYFMKYRPGWQVFLLRLVMLLTHSLRALILRPFNRDESNANWQAAKVALWKPEPR